MENDAGDSGGKPKVGMPFDTEQEAHDMYNAYGGKMGFSIRRGYANKNKDGNFTSRLFVCNKEGFRNNDKRDALTKNPRQEVRTGCEARLLIKWDKNVQKYIAKEFVEQHNHVLVSAGCAHMLPSQRKISPAQAAEFELAEQSGIRLGAAFELMGREAGGREALGFTKLDQKNYLRTKRQQSLAYGEAGSILQYFREKTLENPSFFYTVQLDNEEQITNIFWADAQMIMDYGQFGDVVTFDTTYKLNNQHRPFGSFIGFNHHRETVVFGAALMYDETAESFIWLFKAFLEAMSYKAPKTIFTDQDAAMAKAIPIVMPNTCHRLCTWHLMQNALRHVNCIFKDKGVKGVFSKFLYDIEDEDEFALAWGQMLEKYEVQDNHWLKLTFGVKEKWGWPYVRKSWGAGMSSTQLSESFNAFLKDYIRSDHDLMQFFMHFDRVLCNKRYKELEAEYALCQKLPRVKIDVKMLKQAGDVYTKTIFEEFQQEYVQSIEASIQATTYDGESIMYIVVDDDGRKARKVTMEQGGSLACSCRKFEMKGILCSHCLKVLREAMNVKDLPLQYILKRWTKKARAESVKDKSGHDIQVDAKLHQSTRYRSLMARFRALACRASECDETYKFSIVKADEFSVAIESLLSSKISEIQLGGSVEQETPSNTSPQTVELDGIAVQAKGLKKKECTSRGRRRIKSSLEIALAKRKKSLHVPTGVSCYNASFASLPTSLPLPHASFGTSLHQANAPFVMGSSPLMYPTYNPNHLPSAMPFMYPAHVSFQDLLNSGSGSGYDGLHSQASNSPACSQVQQSTQLVHGHGHGHDEVHDSSNANKGGRGEVD